MQTLISLLSPDQKLIKMMKPTPEGGWRDAFRGRGLMTFTKPLCLSPKGCTVCVCTIISIALMLVGVKKKVGSVVCGSPPPAFYILSSFSHSQSTSPHRTLLSVYTMSLHNHPPTFPRVFMSPAAFSLFFHCCFFSTFLQQLSIFISFLMILLLQ